MDTRRLDLNLLTALEALLAERNVTRAAARLNLSQPALSAQLARLRDVLGDPLLIPAQRGMTPTARALELQEPLRRALDAVRQVVASSTPFDPATADLTIAIAASDYVQTTFLLDAVLEVRRLAPLIRIAVRTLDGRALGSQLERGEVDLALATADTAPPALRSRTLFDERYVVIARRDHPRIHAPLSLAGFAAEEHVIVSPRGGGFSTAADVALAAHGLQRRVVLSAASFLFVPDIVTRSDLIALVPARLVERQSARLAIFEPPVPVPGFTMSALWHDRTHAHPAHAWLRDQVLNADSVNG